MRCSGCERILEPEEAVWYEDLKRHEDLCFIWREAAGEAFSELSQDVEENKKDKKAALERLKKR